MFLIFIVVFSVTTSYLLLLLPIFISVSFAPSSGTFGSGLQGWGSYIQLERETRATFSFFPVFREADLIVYTSVETFRAISSVSNRRELYEVGNPVAITFPRRLLCHSFVPPDGVRVGRSCAIFRAEVTQDTSAVF